MKLIKKSKKLNNVLYDIRGPIVDRAKEMEAQGQQLIKLNIGNLASFDFQVPEEIQRDMILNLPNSAGYSDSKGIFAARKAVMHYTQELGIRGVTLDDIYLGNGASDLISLATNALLDEGDNNLIVAGGVSANAGLRERLEKDCKENDINLSIPRIQYCTDNATMIAAAAYFAYKKNIFADQTLNAVATDSLYKY